MCLEAQTHNSLLKRLRPELGRGLPLFTHLPRETVWKIAKGLPNRVTLGAQKGKTGRRRPVFVAPRALGIRASGISKQFLEEKFSETEFPVRGVLGNSLREQRSRSGMRRPQYMACLTSSTKSGMHNTKYAKVTIAPLFV